jgi:hypothetical protein
LPLVFARCLAFVLLKENRAVSADEKKPDKKSKTVNTRIWLNIIKINLTKTLLKRRHPAIKRKESFSFLQNKNARSFFLQSGFRHAIWH